MRAIVSLARHFILTTIIIAAPLLCSPSFIFSQAKSAHLSLIAQENDTPGKIILAVDQVEKLAGVKVTITYDKEQLKFVKAEKAKDLAAFMHVVNDKNPGTIIIVMASATGVSGTDLPLLHLEFEPNATAEDSTRIISVSQIQLMDENLQEIMGDHPTYLF